MYKIDRKGRIQKSFSRKFPNCIIRIEYNLDLNFFKFDIMKQKVFYFQEFVMAPREEKEISKKTKRRKRYI